MSNTDLNMVKQLLIAKKININQTSQDQKLSPLYLVAQQGQSKIVRALIKAGANVNQENDARINTALGIAAGYGNVDIIEDLINAGAKVDQSNKTKLTPLYFAITNGHYQAVKILLEHNANFEYQLTFQIKDMKKFINTERLETLLAKKNIKANDTIIHLTLIELAQFLGSKNIIHLLEEHSELSKQGFAFI